MSDIQRLGSNPPLQNLKDISKTAPAQKLERSTSMQQLPGQRSGIQKPGLSRTSSFVAQSSEKSLIQSKIDNTSPEQMLAKAAFVPKPGALLKMHAQITGEGTLGKLEAFDNSIRDKRLVPLKQEHQRLQTETGDDGIKESLSNPLAPLKTEPTQLTSMMKMFSGISKDMDKSVFKGKSLDKAEQMARSLMNNPTSHIDGELIKTDDLKFMLATLPEDQAKELLAKGMGLIKNKYQNAGYAQLSENKQQLVDRIYSGMKASINGQENQIIAGKTHEVNRALTEIMKVPNSPQAAELLIRNESELKTYFQQELGLDHTPLNSLPAEAQRLISNTTAKALQLMSSNSVSDQTVPLQDKKGLPVNPPASFQLGDKTYANPSFLGQGGFGNVYAYTNSTDPNDVLVLKEMHGSDDMARKDISEEIRNHTHMMGPDGTGSPHVVNLKGVIRGGEEKIYMVMEKASSDLEKGISKLHDPNSPLDDRQKQLLSRFVARATLESLQYMQRDKNSQHMDIKPENMLIGDDGRIMVADFGSGVRDHEIWNARKDGTPVGVTPNYSAPELVGGKNQQIDQKYDTWSTGVMLHNIMNKEFAIKSWDVFDFNNDLSNRVRTTDDSHKNLDSFDNLVNALNHPDPAQRPTLEAVLQHSFFQDPELNKPEVQQLWVAVLNNDQTEINRLKDLI